MIGCLRPGGLLVAEEPDFASAFHGSIDPVVGPVLTAAIGLLQELGGGMDAAYGRRLFHDVRAAGMVDIGSAGRTHMLRGADADTGAACLRYTVEKVRDRLPGRGGVTVGEVEHVLDLARRSRHRDGGPHDGRRLGPAARPVVRPGRATRWRPGRPGRSAAQRAGRAGRFS